MYSLPSAPVAFPVPSLVPSCSGLVQSPSAHVLSVPPWRRFEAVIPFASFAPQNSFQFWSAFSGVGLPRHCGPCSLMFVCGAAHFTKSFAVIPVGCLEGEQVNSYGLPPILTRYPGKWVLPEGHLQWVSRHCLECWVQKDLEKVLD